MVWFLDYSDRKTSFSATHIIWIHMDHCQIEIVAENYPQQTTSVSHLYNTQVLAGEDPPVCLMSGKFDNGTHPDPMCRVFSCPVPMFWCRHLGRTVSHSFSQYNYTLYSMSWTLIWYSQIVRFIHISSHFKIAYIHNIFRDLYAQTLLFFWRV